MSRTIPEKIPMQRKMFGDGAKGSAVQVLANDDFDVVCVASRKDRFSEFTESWGSGSTGTINFPSWELLRKAMLDDFRDYELMASAEYRKHLHGFTIVAQVSNSISIKGIDSIYIDLDQVIVGDISSLMAGFGDGK